MANFSVFILLIFFESIYVYVMAVSTYCTLPCPFTGPTEPSCCCRYNQESMYPRPNGRGAFNGDDTPEYDRSSEWWPPRIKPRVLRPNDQNGIPTPPYPIDPTSDNRSLPRPDKPDTNTDLPIPPQRRSDPDAKPRKSASYPSPQTRRFFTSLFSIPGAVVDTLLSGEVVL